MKNIIKTLAVSLFVIFFSSNYIFPQTESNNEENKQSLVNDVKNVLNSRGIDFRLGYKGDVFSNLAGGMGRASVYLDNFDIIFNMNLEHIIGWHGASLTTYFLGNHGGEPADHAGVIQGISNISAHDTWKLYEFRLEQILLDGDLSLLAGL